MKFSRAYVILSQVALIAALPGVLLLQLFCVLAAWETGEEFPEVRHLVIPYALAAVAALICVQVLIVALMMLVRAVSKGAFFTAKTMKWINLARLMVAIGPGIVAITGGHMSIFTPATRPEPPLLFLGGIVLGVGLFSLVSLAKSIFQAALDDAAELAEVI